MTDVAVQPIKPFDTTVSLPGSKSITNRALVLSALAEGTSTLESALFAEDTELMVDALRVLGFEIDAEPQSSRLIVHGRGGEIPAVGGEIFVGNAGTVMRFLTAVVCLGRGRFTMDGTERMRQRPIAELVEPLRTMGARIEYLGRQGYPPLAIEATGLSGGQIVLKRLPSSQMLSALLMAVPYARSECRIILGGEVPSLPYVQMTIAMMKRFGVRLRQTQTGFVVAAPQRYRPGSYRIEPDATNASYFLAAAAVCHSRLTVLGLGSDSIQGDVGFAKLLARMGACVRIQRDSITVEGTGQLLGIDADLNEMPDVAQTLAVVALFADGPTHIRNIGNLRVKETDRISALANELSKLGAAVQTTADSIRIIPPLKLRPARIQTYNDHRMAMSFAVAGLRSGAVTICNAECVAKSFPDFFQRLAQLGR